MNCSRCSSNPPSIGDIWCDSCIEESSVEESIFEVIVEDLENRGINARLERTYTNFYIDIIDNNWNAAFCYLENSKIELRYGGFYGITFYANLIEPGFEIAEWIKSRIDSIDKETKDIYSLYREK